MDLHELLVEARLPHFLTVAGDRVERPFVAALLRHTRNARILVLCVFESKALKELHNTISGLSAGTGFEWRTLAMIGGNSRLAFILPNE